MTEIKKSYREIVYDHILPHLKMLVENIIEQRERLTLEGIRAFEEGDFFVPGKIVNGTSYIVTMDMQSDSKKWLNYMTDIIDLTATMDMKTWGYLNYLIGLYRLKKEGFLDKVLSTENEALLKEKLDWRIFVDTEDLSLINLPTNYYGVAFGIARYRELLGWEDGNNSQILFDKLLKHVSAFSGEYLFMDETNGEGRFDRYSILIAGEMASMLSSTDLEVPKYVVQMLERSTDICLSLANKAGNGISYGRSIGAYGDTAVIEVLSIAAKLNIIDKQQKRIGYGYNTCIANKMANFWIDSTINSINMWDKGRRTDAYRHKGRILGENFSLSCQILHGYHQWIEAGFDDPIYDESWEETLNEIEPFKFVRFSKGIYDRGLAIIRDGHHVFSLPLINGGGGTAGDVHGNSYYKASPYLPIPNENGVLETPPDTFFAQLVPRIKVGEKTEVMPIAYQNEITTTPCETGGEVIYTQNTQCIIGDRYPENYEGITSKTSYTFRPGLIEREDEFIAKESGIIKEVVMDFITFSDDYEINGSEVQFYRGPIECIIVEGLRIQSVEEISDDYEYCTSHQQLKTRIRYCLEMISDTMITVKWTIKYRNKCNI